MCTLTFDYDWANADVGNDMWPFQLAEISHEDKIAFEKRTNLKYKDYCSRINESGGKIIVGYTKDGKKTMHHVLECPEDLFREIQNDLG